MDWEQFINFWKQFYYDPHHEDEKYYYPYINNLSKEDFLDKLWRWKMQVPYFNNRSNQRKLELMKQNKAEIRSFRKSETTFNKLYSFSRKFFRSGVVYSVFLIHICKPEEYPIFDQHVYRAFHFIKNRKIVKEPRSFQNYLDYRDFILRIHRKHSLNLRDIDKALMAFGKFLENPLKYLDKCTS